MSESQREQKGGLRGLFSWGAKKENKNSQNPGVFVAGQEVVVQGQSGWVVISFEAKKKVGLTDKVLVGKIVPFVDRNDEDSGFSEEKVVTREQLMSWNLQSPE